MLVDVWLRTVRPLVGLAIAVAVVVACAEETSPRPLVPTSSSSGGGSGGDGGVGGAATGGAGGADPFGAEDDIYVIPEDTPNCEYDWILPACNLEAGEECHTALDCLPTCCDCPDGSVYGAGACDFASDGDATGTCAYDHQVCWNTKQSCG